jgi:rifampicin phosphotransferase
MTNAMICWLQDVDERQVGRVGGKGANLGRLLHLGLPVPPGFVVTTDAYRAVLAFPDLAAAGPEQRRALLPTAPLPDDISAAILDAYRRLAAPAVAVRSSGTAEDLAAASFAGQHDTFLNVAGPDALLAAVRGCWASLWSERAVAYRRAQGWDARDLALAVVVQAMVPAERAGVLFTADPVSGRRDHLVIEAVSGLGEALVSGQATPSRAVVEKASLRLLAGDAPLPVGALEDLARLGLRIEGAFGAPQDVEWAYADGGCVILQARPLTAVPAVEAPSVAAQTDTAPQGRRYSRVQRAGAPNMLEHMPVSPSPFDYALFYRPLMARVLQALRSLGFATSALDEVFIAVAEGVVQAVPPSITPTLRVLTLPPKLLAALRASPDDWLRECRALLVVPAQQIDTEDLALLSTDALLDRIATLQQRLVDLTVRRFGVLAPRLLLTQTFPLLLRLAVGRAAPRLQADLLAAVPCTTTAANQELERLARLGRETPELRQIFVDEPPERVAERLRDVAAGPAFLAALDAFLRCYGYRESAMPAAALPAWRDDPRIVYGLLKGRAASTQETSALNADDGQRAERTRQALVAALGRGRLGPATRLLLPLYLRRLAAARALIAFREDSHFALVLAFPVIRRLALELGRRLVARGALAEPGDIFFLELEEIRRLGPAAVVQETVRRRHEARQSVAGRATAVPAALLAQTATSGELHGAAASPGTATGPVRVIREAHEFWMLQAGEVLVAPYTSPAWTPLFALARAVVVDAGGVASHAAIVAREYGIPAVMGTGRATRVLRTGQHVLVDGTRGRVVPLDEGADIRGRRSALGRQLNSS